MRIIDPSFEVIDFAESSTILTRIESAGRTCYKSEKHITEDSAESFVRRIINNGHESALEHEKITVRMICDRGVSHEIVRHRIASYSQESTRYCNYSNSRFGTELTFIRPCFWEEHDNCYLIWKDTLLQIEKNYFSLIKNGAKPEEARTILPNSLKTEIVITMNLREWRIFFKLRTAPAAHPQMRQIATNLLNEFVKRLPCVFDDIVQ
jgi:thymidylate synthase (FAD)